MGWLDAEKITNNERENGGRRAMYPCPACGTENGVHRDRCRCGADLSLLKTLDGLVNAWFNRGRKALEEEKTGEALEWFSACCAARPLDAALRRIQARMWVRLGRREEAESSLRRAESLEPGAPELTEIREALREAKEGHGHGEGEG